MESPAQEECSPDVAESTETLTPSSSTSVTTTSPPPQDTEKKARKEAKESKKDDKSLEQFMKSLNSISSVDEKLAIVCKKYVQSAEDLKKLQFYVKHADKRYSMMLKEKEHLQHEYNRTILVKSTLENLCRELQKQNKAIKEESLLKIREEEERRKETQTKFQSTLSEIATVLQENSEQNVKLRDDNITMSEKFKSVVQQYQLREQQVDKLAKQMALESQLADAKLQKANLEYQAEKERLVAEMEHLKVTLEQYKVKFVEMQGTETALRGQLAVYTDKYDEFQNALTKSNQVFGGFKEQMEMMSGKIKKLEKESLSWQKRWEATQKALLDMCGERQVSEERVAATLRQLQHMQSLCRTLQAERTVLLTTLKDHNIERPPLPQPSPAVTTPVNPPPPAPSKMNDAKMDAMVANCAHLRQSLAQLQSQLDVITTKKANEEPAKSEKQKKSKSKKSKAEKLGAKNEAETGDVKDNESDEQKAGKKSSNESEVQEITGQTEVVSEPNSLETEEHTINTENAASYKEDDITTETLAQLGISMESIKLGILKDRNSDMDINKLNHSENGQQEVEAPQSNIEFSTSTENGLQDTANVKKNYEQNEMGQTSATNEEITHIAEEKPITE